MTQYVLAADWNTWKLKLETHRSGSWYHSNQRWRRVGDFLLSKWRTPTVLTLDEEGNALIDYKNPEQDANQEWEVSIAPEAAAASSPPTGLTLQFRLQQYDENFHFGRNLHY